MADGFAHMRVSFDMSLKDSLLITFFTTAGLPADARMLVKRIENSPSSSSSAAFSNAVSRGKI